MDARMRRVVFSAPKKPVQTLMKNQYHFSLLGHRFFNLKMVRDSLLPYGGGLLPQGIREGYGLWAMASVMAMGYGLWAMGYGLWHQLWLWAMGSVMG